MDIIKRATCEFIANTEVWTTKSSINENLYRITVTRPPMPPPDDKKGCGLIVVDGDHMAGMLVSSTGIMAMGQEVPPTVVVSIGYPFDSETSWISLRNRDLTPTRFPPLEKFSTLSTGEASAETGGARSFLQFIVEELQPALEEECSLDPDEWTLTGASLGGLFTVYSLLEAPNSFRRFNAVSPSLWWDHRSIYEQAKTFEPELADKSRAIFISAGEFESAEHLTAMNQALPPEIATAFRNCFETGGIPLDMTLDAHEMAAILRRKPGIEAVAKTMPGESHTSVMGVAQSQGLRWLHKATSQSNES